MLAMVGIILGFMMSLSEYVIEVNSESQLKQVIDDNFWEIEIDDGELEIRDINFYTKQVSTLIYDENGTLLYGQSPNKVEVSLPYKDYGLEKVEIKGREYYIYDRLFSVEPFPVFWLRGIIEVQKDSDVINSIFLIAFILLPIIIIVAAIGSYQLSKKALYPIEKIIATAQDIHASGDFSLRINLGTGRDEVHQLAETFDEMFVKIEDSFEMEKQFASDVSHELRTPTAIILAQCEMSELETKEEYQESVEVIKRQASKMSTLIASLLNLTRMDRGLEKGEFEIIDISELTSIVCEELELITPCDSFFEYHIEPNIMAMVDQGLFMRLISNLVSNGFAYGKLGGYVKVGLYQKNGKVILEVEDNGIGIAQEHIDKIWNRFYQVDMARTAQKGNSMGLGLSMVEQIVKMHSGEIQVDSKVGEGSCFKIFLSTS